MSDHVGTGGFSRDYTNGDGNVWEVGPRDSEACLPVSIPTVSIRCDPCTKAAGYPIYTDAHASRPRCRSCGQPATPA